MKARYFALALTLAFSANATAGEAVIAALADETGLTTRQVKMVVGPRSSHAAYLASYDQVQRQFVKAIGRARYTELLAGREVKRLKPGQRLASVTIAKPQS